MNFKFNVNVTEQDYLNFNLFVATKTPHGKKVMLRSRLLITAAVALALLLVWITRGLSRVSVITTVLILLILLYFQAYHNRRMENSLRNYKRGLKKPAKLPFSPVPTKEFNDEAIIDTDENSVTERKYSAIEAIYFDKNALYIFIGAAEAFILPYSCFVSREQMDAFIAFLTAKRPDIVRY